MSGEASHEERQSWQQWRAAHPDHERAWQHIEAITGRLKQMEPKAAYRTLSPYVAAPRGAQTPASPGRRKALQMLMWGGVDACKEQMTAASDALLVQGIATVAMDNAGTGESPVKGVPDAERGQIVKAYVVLKPGHAADAGMVTALQEFVKQTVAPYKYPRAVEFATQLPRTSTGKLQRFRLRGN